MNHNTRETAIQTIGIEGKAVMGLQQYINESFEQAIKAMHACTGRIIISGMGKSALVAQKIVATLNSTGTPSAYMHAADAIHGDLGMVRPEDVVIVISKSGESPEIKALVPLVKNFGNTLIGMVGNMNAYLAHQSDIVLNTTVEEEACVNNLAPTSSTTAQMVMGDVLAVCLMQLNNFTPNDFARFHPGGALGKKLLLTVNDMLAKSSKPMVFPNTPLKDVIVEISNKRMGATVVVNTNETVTGIITDGDIRRLLEKTTNLEPVTAADIMNTKPKTILSGAMAADALNLLREHDISQVIVVNNDQTYCGIIHLHDLLQEGLM
ncbi:MAG: KpsF/GutQ family sugar-phosphate isomerase [Dinghuibacter sp.]|nr:KpsF/GutQ family sugar-phosphate isomerase [Dinghuibacter sp.]